MQVQVLFPAPNQYNPNQVFQIGNWFGFFLSSRRKGITHQALQARSVCKGLRFLRSLAKQVYNKTVTFFI